METGRPSQDHKRLPALSVRARIIGSVLLMTAAGMVVAGFLNYAVQSARISDRVDQGLTQEVEEFSRAAGPAPAADEMEALQVCEDVLAAEVPRVHEVFACFVEGSLVDQVGERYLDLAHERAALERLGAVEGDVRSTAPTSRGTLQFATRPLATGSGEVGVVYVAGRLIDLERQRLEAATQTHALVSAVALLLVGLVGAVVAGRMLKPIRELRATAQQITDSDLSRRIAVHGDDDISEIAGAFNAMLDRLEDSFATQRRFLDDAGHELKTPLTIVRGHLELLDPHASASVSETRDIVIEEVDRMCRLVQDLAVLAKLVRPDFVQAQPFRVADLLDDVLGKARVLAPRLWRLDGCSVQAAHGDPQRLTQALLQLADNAIRYTQEQDVIALGAELDAESRMLRLWVRDTGSGIHAEVVERVFERFYRGHDRRAEGSGLGLSIVSAIAEGHHGRVEVSSSPGAGATFTLVLPLESLPQPEPEHACQLLVAAGV